MPCHNIVSKFISNIYKIINRSFIFRDKCTIKLNYTSISTKIDKLRNK